MGGGRQFSGFVRQKILKRSGALFGSVFVAIAILSACDTHELSHSDPPTDGAGDVPLNILMIVVDDLGFSDLGAYGGEISTPNLDELAYRGVRLTNFHVAPNCSPTRAMLMSGVDSHLSGLGIMESYIGPAQKGQPGYEGYLNFDVVSVATILKDAGYRTMMSGKWHLGLDVENGPESRGFKDVFVLPTAASNHFQQTKAYGVKWDEVRKETYRENGDQVDLPEVFYSSELFTDKLISYLSSHFERDEKAPFFALASYTAPHWPLQAPDEFINKYEGVYEVGYDEVAQARLQRMRDLGIIDSSTEVITSAAWPHWGELSDEQRAKEARRMQVYAGMVEALDHHIGRLTGYLEEKGVLNNTVIIFLSDNGAEGNDPHHIAAHERWIPANFVNTVENMGRADSFISYGPRWAEVSSLPHRGFKAYPLQGGIIAPAFITHPESRRAAEISNDPVTVLDITPTVLDVAGVEHPGTKYAGRDIHPLTGKSIKPYLSGASESVHGKDFTFGVELFNRRALRKGNWKLVWIEPPNGIGSWQLFDLSADAAEQHDIFDQNPDIASQLIAQWENYENANGVILDPDISVRYSTNNSHYEH